MNAAHSSAQNGHGPHHRKPDGRSDKTDAAASCDLGCDQGLGKRLFRQFRTLVLKRRTSYTDIHIDLALLSSYSCDLGCEQGHRKHSTHPSAGQSSLSVAAGHLRVDDMSHRISKPRITLRALWRLTSYPLEVWAGERAPRTVFSKRAARRQISSYRYKPGSSPWVQRSYQRRLRSFIAFAGFCFADSGRLSGGSSSCRPHCLPQPAASGRWLFYFADECSCLK